MGNTLSSQRDEIIEFAKAKIAEHPVYLDTETTGLSKQDEVIEIAIVDFDGNLIYNRLVKPSQPIPKEATAINHITNEMVKNEQAWLILWPTIRNSLYGRLIGAYNSDFDRRMMEQSHARYRQPWRDKLNFLDVLPIYCAYRGEWNAARSSYRYFKLEEAGKELGISIPNAHRSLQDALLTRAVLHRIAGLSY